MTFMYVSIIEVYVYILSLEQNGADKTRPATATQAVTYTKTSLLLPRVSAYSSRVLTCVTSSSMTVNAGMYKPRAS
jgi:hypothetical protein